MNDETGIVKELAETTARSKSNAQRIDKLEETSAEIKSLATSTAVLAEKMGTMETNVSEIKTTVNTLKDVPAKRWENLIEKVLWLIVGGLITFAFARAGINL